MRDVFVISLWIGLAMGPLAAQVAKRAQLRSVEVNMHKIVVRGAYLGKVEVWAVPTGTGITPNEYALVGNARRKTAAGRNELWSFQIKCTSPLILSTEVFVKAFDPQGIKVGRKS